MANFQDNDLSSRSASFNTNGNWTASRQPPPFRATKRGLQNALPDFPATAENANGILTNPVGNAALRKHYLFVTEVETGWALAGQTSQAAYHRTFYPRNLSQNQLTIVVQCANQYEADRITQFVSHHQRTILTSALNEGALGHLDFKLLPATTPHIKVPLKRGQKRRYLHRGMHYGIVVDDVEAGHERFNHFPLVRLTCTVVADFISPNITVEDKLYKNLIRNYMQTFGTIYDPKSSVAAGGNNAPESSNGNGDLVSFWDDFHQEHGT